MWRIRELNHNYYFLKKEEEEENWIMNLIDLTVILAFKNMIKKF